MTKPARSLLLKLAIASAVGGLLLPILFIVLFGLLAGMVMFFYFLFPLLSVITGVLAGRYIKSLWFYPVVNALFLLYWVVRTCGFQLLPILQSSGSHILLGALSMALSAAIRWLMNHRADR